MSWASRFFGAVLALFVLTLDSLVFADGSTLTFRGVRPGETSEEQLLAHEKWGEPAKREMLDDGSTWLRYELRGYKSVGVVVRSEKVQTIDVLLPDGLKPADAAQALGLGTPTKDETLPPPAHIGGPTNANWTARRYLIGRAALYTDSSTGDAKLLRLYAEQIVPHIVARPALPGGDLALPPDGSDITNGPAAPITPTAVNRQVIQSFAKLIEQSHFSGHPIDDEIARRTLDGYINHWDPAKSFFLVSDVESFQRRYDQWDNQIKSGDLGPAFQIFNAYVDCVRQRVALIDQLVDMPHDFQVDERLMTDWAAADFPENDLEIREIWRKRIKYELLTHKAAGTSDDEARRLTRQKYENFLERIERFDADDVVDSLAKSLAAAYDPHSNYISPKEFANHQIQVRAELFGIGASLKIADGYLTVVKVLPNSPAAKEGSLQSGDRVVAVGQGTDGDMVNIVGMEMTDAVELMRGEKGTTVRLRVIPPQKFESTVISIVRDKVELSQIGSAVLSGDQLPGGRNAKLGFIYLPSFFTTQYNQEDETAEIRSTTSEVQRILRDFRSHGVDVVVLDFRNNGGGSLTEAINLPGLFLGPNALVLQVKGRDGQVQTYNTPETKIVWDGPLTVLTSKASAGGSEILAAAMQDTGRAFIIGDSKTHGLGTVANVIDIGRQLFSVENPPQLGHLKVVTQKLYRPSGDSMQLRGVVPDVVVSSLYDAANLGEESLDHALQFDRVAPGLFAKTDFALNERSRQDIVAASQARFSDTAYAKRVAEKQAQQKTEPSRFISLREDDFMAAQSGQSETDTSPPVPGIDDVRMDEQLKECLAVSLDYAARVSLAKAERLYKDRDFNNAIAAYDRAIAADPNYADAHYKLAWIRGTCPEANIRNGKAAVEHARRACELNNWQAWHFVLALAIAEAEAGDFAKAQQELTKALDMAPASQQAAYRYLEQRFRQRQPFQSR